MKFSFLIIFLFTIAQGVYSQVEEITEESVDETEFLVGETDRRNLQVGDFGQHFLEEYKSYHPDVKDLNEIGNKLFSYKITIVMATWCHDSQEQLPRFFKIMDILDYNTNYIKIICVDKEKSGGDTEISDLNIELVPTFIFYKNDLEKGRIIETPINTIENDILDILNK